MNKYSFDCLLAIVGGGVLALMINYNSLMAKYTNPIFASWVAHGIGALTSLLFIFLVQKRKFLDSNKIVKSKLWQYLGGIPGAFTVILAAITVNSSLGLSGSLSLMLLGQIIAGLVYDRLGLFNSVKRKINMIDCLAVIFVFLGSILIIFFNSN